MKPKVKALMPAEVVIEHGIPMPQSNPTCKEIVSKMAIGDSILVNIKKASGFLNLKGFKFKTHKESPTAVRIWRAA